MRILYWLAKEEVAHFTKFDSPKQLCLDLGCDDFRELNVSCNAKYNSHRMIEEWLTILSDVIEEDLLKRRFPDLPIIHLFQVFDRTLLPTSTNDMQKYGES